MNDRTCSTANGLQLEHSSWEGDWTKVVGEPQKEVVLVLLGGSLHCEVTSGPDPTTRTLSRSDPFDGPAVGLLLPPGHTATCTPGEGGAEVVLASAPAPAGSSAAWLGVPVRESRGSGSWQREVGTLVTPPTSAAILLGETVARDGRWSTFPPHKHEVSNPPLETAMREAFCFRVRPGTGFGVLLNYRSEAADGTATVLGDSSLAVVDQGYHAVASAAGHDLYYLWAASGADNELVFHTDPQHAWLLDGDR